MLIGLTGGIACGKSTVADALRARGAVIVDADQVARDVVAPGTPGLAAVVEAFGEGVLDADGRLDRSALGARVFGDEGARRRLEGILHPLIAQESMVQLQAAAADGPPLVVYDAALLVESGRADLFRPLVVVSAPEAVQRERLMARDGLDRAAAEARIAAQMPVADKAAVADHVIDNGGDLAATAAQIDALWARLVEGAP
ncbi:MAG: dephospho-CoA kinase [Myxococcales bacterium]|nr:dephospho-CoA kinase [Myxococcales bacterium]MCB9538957.1 dephospho-CoA kinase [Myxococcales bacterium]